MQAYVHEKYFTAEQAAAHRGKLAEAAPSLRAGGKYTMELALTDDGLREVWGMLDVLWEWEEGARLE